MDWNEFNKKILENDMCIYHIFPGVISKSVNIPAHIKLNDIFSNLYKKDMKKIFENYGLTKTFSNRLVPYEPYVKVLNNSQSLSAYVTHDDSCRVLCALNFSLDETKYINNLPNNELSNINWNVDFSPLHDLVAYLKKQ